MTTIFIDNEEYISSEELFLKAPIYCKVSRTGRDLNKKKKITEFIYAKLINKKWTVSDGKSNKFDKVFYKKSFIDTIPEMNQIKEQVIIDDNNIQLAPEIIQLTDQEKFKDENNNILDIETRGERKVDNIYFKIKDVMIGFKLDNLDKNIHDKKSYFKENEHYIYFNCKKISNNRTKVKKELYLTYNGFQRVIFLSKNKCTKNNLYILKKWLDNFDKKVLNNYKVNIGNNIIQNKIGYVYIVSSNLLDAVKIGMWRSSIETLYSRYITCYGKNIHIDYFLTSNARELEYKTHKYFKDYQITNELFNKMYYNKYIDFIKTNIDESNIQLNDNLYNISDNLDNISDDLDNISDELDNISDITDNISNNSDNITETHDVNYNKMQQKILLLENQVKFLTNLL